MSGEASPLEVGTDAGISDAELAAERRSAPALSLLARRRRWAWTTVVVVLVVAFSSGYALRGVRSPQQALLDAAAAPRTVVTADVVLSVVSETVVGRGTVAAAAPVEVPLPVVTEGHRALVTSEPRDRGSSVAAGEVVVEIAGRPLIALPGAVPAFRDLRPGDSGGDVRQFQQAVADLGFALTVDGEFGERTKAAVRWLYENLGYQTPSTTGLGEPTSEEVTAAEDVVRDAERQVAGLESQLRAAQAPQPAASEPAEGGGSAPTDTAALAGQLEDARSDVVRAQTALDSVEALTGPMVPSSEIAYVPTLPAQVVEAGGALGGPAPDPVAVLSTDSPVVQAGFEPVQAARLRPEMAVALVDETTGWTASGTVTDVAAAAAVDDDSAPTSTVTISADDIIPGEMIGASLRVDVTEAATDGEVLAVPVAAITGTADGSAYVVLVDDQGGQRKVEVTPGVSGGGLVEITPTGTEPAGGGLAVGDSVVISQ